MSASLTTSGAAAQAWTALSERRWEAARKGFAMAGGQGDDAARLGAALIEPPASRLAALEAAAESGRPEALYALGASLLGRDRPRAVGLFRRAAEADFAPAMTRLSEAAPAASAEARTWARRAAELGDPFAMARLGRILAHTPARKDALAWLYAAAALGADPAAARDARALARLMLAREIADGQRNGRALVKKFKARAKRQKTLR